ncbi:hypothetical protein P9112_007076 [Eukaryota sp. TZLM1-RC]
MKLNRLIEPTISERKQCLKQWHFVFPLFLALVLRLGIHIFGFFVTFGGRVFFSPLFLSMIKTFFQWFVLTSSIYILVIGLCFFVFTALNLRLFGFYFLLYFISIVFFLLPISNLLFTITSGQQLTPSTIHNYGQSTTTEASSIVDMVLDTIRIAHSLAPKVTLISIIIVISVIFVLSVVDFMLRRRLKKLTNDSYLPNIRLFFLVSFTISLIIALSPTATALRFSNNPIILSTKPVDAYFFFRLPSIPASKFLEGKVLFREMFPLPEGMFWISEEFPLVFGPKSKYCQFNEDLNVCGYGNSTFFDYNHDINDDVTDDVNNHDDSDPPDIFLILWESFSGNAHSSVDSPLMENSTPYLDEFFQQHGVLFHEVVSNGCPTANSWWSMLNQALPLAHGNSILDTLSINFDPFTKILKRHSNYTSIYSSAANPDFDGKDRWLSKDVFDEHYFEYANDPSSMEHPTPLAEKYASIWNNDRIGINQFSDQIRNFDRNNVENHPLFGWFLSVSSHNPYTTFDSEEVVGSPLPEDQFDKYNRTLRYSDYYLVKKFIDFLKTRDRINNTVLVFIGDHAAYRVTGLEPECKGCPISPFENDQMFYTTATLGFFGDDERRSKLKIPEKGTKIYSAASAFDVISTILELGGATKDLTSHSIGRSLLNTNLTRHTLSFINTGAELGTRDQIVRVDWAGSKRLVFERPHPTYVNSTRITEDSEWFPKIQSLNLFWNHLIHSNAVWHEDFLLSEVDFPKATQPIAVPVAKDSSSVVLIVFGVLFVLSVLMSIFAFFFSILFPLLYRTFFIRRKNDNSELLPLSITDFY